MEAVQLFLLVWVCGGVMCAATYALAKHRLEHSWKWRLFLCLLIGATITPTCVPVLTQTSVAPAVILGAILLFEGGEESLFGLLYGVLPIVIAASVVFVLWSHIFSRGHQREKHLC